MTEQQINTLKNLLASSKEVENSTELDAAILNASKENAPRSKNTSSSWYTFLPISPLVTAALAITISVGALLAMSQAISVDQKVNSYALNPKTSSELILEIAPGSVSEPPVLDELSNIKKPGLPPEFGSRAEQDQILAEIELPSVQALLEGKEFSFADERLLAENSLRSALVDINQMLHKGALNEARDRYDRLRRSCSVCELPSSLEALALAKDKTKNKSTTRI